MAKKKDKTPDLEGMSGPGVAPVKIPELDKAIDQYVVARDKRMIETPKEKAHKTIVIELMLAHQEEIGVNGDGKISYTHGGEIVTLEPGKPKLSVREATEPE